MRDPFPSLRMLRNWLPATFTATVRETRDFGHTLLIDVRAPGVPGAVCILLPWFSCERRIAALGGRTTGLLTAAMAPWPPC